MEFPLYRVMRPGQYGGYSGDFVVRGGLIVSVWNNWWGVWVVWYQKVWTKLKRQTRRIFKGKPARSIDHNRGRHWNRKAS